MLAVQQIDKDNILAWLKIKAKSRAYQLEGRAPGLATHPPCPPPPPPQGPSTHLRQPTSCMSVCRQGEDAAPTRVMVFAPTSEAAQACAPPIRNVLWGAHKVAVLLPQGEEPIKVPKLPFSLHLYFASPGPY